MYLSDRMNTLIRMFKDHDEYIVFRDCQMHFLRNKIASLIRKSKRNYFNKAIEDNRTTSVHWGI